MNQVLRAPDAGLGPDEPTTFGPATLHLQLLRGHAGDRPAAYRYGSLLKPQATETGWNGPDQWLATRRLSTPPGFIASPLHRVVSSLVKQGRTKSCHLRDKSTRLAVSWPAMIRSHMTFEGSANTCFLQMRHACRPSSHQETPLARDVMPAAP